jgi:hypothetical protein
MQWKSLGACQLFARKRILPLELEGFLQTWVRQKTSQCGLKPPPATGREVNALLRPCHQFAQGEKAVIHTTGTAPRLATGVRHRPPYREQVRTECLGSALQREVGTFIPPKIASQGYA